MQHGIRSENARAFDRLDKWALGVTITYARKVKERHLGSPHPGGVLRSEMAFRNKYVTGGILMLSPEDIAANPIGTHLIFEDDQVRIWQIVLEPGQEAPTHTHLLDYTTITVEGSTLERLNGDGSVDRTQPEPGRIMRWHQGTQTHGLRNVGNTRFRNVIVEIKDTPADFSQAKVEGR